LLLPWHKDKLLRRYTPRCPVLYLYGERKPLMFHSDRWVRIVEETGGKVFGVEGAGHWLMESHPEAVNAELLDWFSSRTE
jgi:pimeloyl-ACP methyl ester carboxylesterase